MSSPDQEAVAAEVRISASPEAVFAFLVEPDKMARWMGARLQLEPRPGGVYAVDLNSRARARGAYLEVVPHSRVVFTFGWEDDPDMPPGSTTVEVTLEPDGDGTHVRLVHRGIPSAESREQHRSGWQHYLSRLGIAAASGDPGPDPNADPA